MEVHEDGLHPRPVLPPKVGSFGFSIRDRGHAVHLEFASETARAGVDLGHAELINVDISGTPVSPGPDHTIDVPFGPTDGGRGSGSG